MNTKLSLLIICIGTTALMAKAEYRNFTDAKGRTISGEILKYDSRKEVVSIKCKNRGTKSVPIGIFSEKDQSYIISWNENQFFLSDRFLNINVTRVKKKNKRKSNEHYVSSSKSYDNSFLIKLNNTSTIDFDNVKIEYVIHYEQEVHINHRLNKREEKCTFFGKTTVSIPKKSEISSETKIVEIKTYRESDCDLVWPDLSGKVHGIIIRLSLKTESGETISKEIRHPKSLKQKWTPQNKKPNH